MKPLHVAVASACSLIGTSIFCSPSRAQSLLFSDTFQTSAGSNDINFQDTGGRQSGVVGPLSYLELPQTALGGSADSLTAINLSGIGPANSLYLGSNTTDGFVYASPNYNFVQTGQFDIKVTMFPDFGGSRSTGDDWAGIIFGTGPGEFITQQGTGILFRIPGSVYEVWDDGTMIQSGLENPFVNADGSISLDINVNTSPLYNGSGTTNWTISAGGRQLIAHTRTSGYLSDYITLGNELSTPTQPGIQGSYFKNLSITGNAVPETSALLLSGLGFGVLLPVLAVARRRTP